MKISWCPESGPSASSEDWDFWVPVMAQLTSTGSPRIPSCLSSIGWPWCTSISREEEACSSLSCNVSIEKSLPTNARISKFIITKMSRAESEISLEFLNHNWNTTKFIKIILTLRLIPSKTSWPMKNWTCNITSTRELLTFWNKLKYTKIQIRPISSNKLSTMLEPSSMPNCPEPTRKKFKAKLWILPSRDFPKVTWTIPMTLFCPLFKSPFKMPSPKFKTCLMKNN